MVCTSSRVFGAEVMSLNILSGLKRCGHELIAVTTKWTDGEFGRRLKALEVSEAQLRLGGLVLRPSWHGFWWTAQTLAYLPGDWTGFFRLLKTFRPNVLILTNPKQALLLYCFLGQQPAVLIEHSAKLVDAPNKWMYRMLGRKLKRFVATSDYMAKQLSNLGVPQEKICVIKIGACSETLLEKNDQAVVERDKKFRTPLRIGISGQISPQKGYDCLIEAAALLKTQSPSFVVSAFGSGNADYINRLKKQISAAGLEENWRWMGYETEQKKIYGEMDICVVPSCFDEPFGMVAVEASAYGLPVVASRRGGLPEIVQDGVTGWLVESNEPAQLAERIQWLIERPEQARQMGMAGRKRIFKHFTVEKTVMEFEALFKESMQPSNE
jgi:glycosyltransferase involved in cell wall biosynthesis